jgi:Leucine-rich repeat (LRR) protein
MPAQSTLTLDVHYLYFLLVQFEYLGLEQTQLPVPENGLVETETTQTAGQAPSIVSSVGSVMSNMSLTTGWQFWNKQERNNGTAAVARPLHEDIVFIHRYLSRVSALKLHMNLLVDTQKGVTRSGQRMIRGYETPIPHDLVLTLCPFKKLSYLELNNLHPSFFADSWDDLRQHLVSCVIKAGSIDNASDVIGQKHWPCLKMLSLADNSITTLEQEPLQYVQSLTHLNLSSNLLIDIPAALASLYNLSSLNVSYNMISFTTSINTVLGNIQELDLRGNRLTLLAGLDRLWALERLDVRDNRIDDAGEIGRLTALPNIHDIWVEGNPFTKLNVSLFIIY